MASNTKPVIELDDIVKKFGDITAVDGVDLEVVDGEFFSLLGPSGCGKTTSLRIVGGFEEPTYGELILNGESASNLPPNKRDVHLVFQSLSLFPHMTVVENVEYGLKKANVKKEERDQRISKYLELVDLSGFENRQPSELSGGQQQRVAVARALVNEPSVLLLDEPLASLDRKLRERMQVELSRIQKEVKTTFFYVTHNQEVAMTLSDRLAIMNNGKIEQVGTPEEIYQSPATEFVADFIGDTNILDVTVTIDEQDDSSLVTMNDMDGVSFKIGEIIEEGNGIVSIRPEHIQLQSNKNGLFNGEIIERYFQGDHINYTIKPNLNKSQNIQIVDYETQTAFSKGDEISVSFDEDSLVFFPDR